MGRSKYLFRNVSDRCQHPQHIQEAIVVVLALDGSAAVAFWQRFEDLGGDEFGAEQRGCRVVDGGLKGHCDLFETLETRQSGGICVVERKSQLDVQLRG